MQASKSLHGLKQASRAWFEQFSHYLPSLGFRGSYADPSLFVRHFESSITVVLLYVDDLVMTGNDNTYITHSSPSAELGF